MLSDSQLGKIAVGSVIVFISVVALEYAYTHKHGHGDDRGEGLRHILVTRPQVRPRRPVQEVSKSQVRAAPQYNITQTAATSPSPKLDGAEQKLSKEQQRVAEAPKAGPPVPDSGMPLENAAIILFCYNRWINPCLAPFFSPRLSTRAVPMYVETCLHMSLR